MVLENQAKKSILREQYHQNGKLDFFEHATDAFIKQQALHEVLTILYEHKTAGRLNNSNIPTMVENYFFEMNVIIHELSRTLAPGGRIYMVNDNVQYMGEEVPVDLILSDFAEHSGLNVDAIWVLPRAKAFCSSVKGIWTNW